MSRTRTVALLLLAAGCAKPDTPPSALAKPAVTASVPAASPAAVRAPAPNPASAVDLPAATAAADKFLTWLPTGTVELGAVAPEFQSILAGGSGRLEWATERYLRGFLGTGASGPRTVAPLPDGTVLAVTPPSPTAGRTVVRLAKGEDGWWRAVWVHQSPSGPVPELTADPATLAQRFAVAAFVEPALTNQPRLAEAALTPAGRAAVAPPLGNDPLRFSRGTLSNKLKSFAGSATGYTLTTVGPTATGELLGPGGEKRPFKLTLAGNGVSDFEPR